MPGRQAASQPRPAGGLTAGPPGFQPGSHSSARQPAQLGTSQPAHQPAILVQPAAHSQPATHSHPASQPAIHTQPASQPPTAIQQAPHSQPATHSQADTLDIQPASQPATASHPACLPANQPLRATASKPPTARQPASASHSQPASQPTSQRATASQPCQPGSHSQHYATIKQLVEINSKATSLIPRLESEKRTLWM